MVVKVVVICCWGCLILLIMIGFMVVMVRLFLLVFRMVVLV